MDRLLKAICLSAFLIFNTSVVFSQATDSANSGLLELLQQDTPTNLPAIGTFNGTRIINGHSVENIAPGIMDFRISHRFGKLNSGFQEFFGLDGATTRLGFDFGITKWLMIGVGRSSYNKEYDGFLKAKILQQRATKSPVAISYLGAASINSRKVIVPVGGNPYYFSNRLAFTNQLLIARKFSKRLSLQLMPTHVHYNLVPLRTDKNDVFAIGIAGKMKLSKRISLTGEYFYTLPSSKLAGSRNALGFGLDFETGGHVFQLIFSNSIGQTERTVIGQTDGDWSKGDIHFGFNISRIFTIVKPKAMDGLRNRIY